MKRVLLASLIASAFPLGIHAQEQDSVAKQTLPTTKEVTSGQALAQSQDGYADVARRQAGVTPQTAEGNGAPAFAIRGIRLNPQANFRLDGGVAVTAVQSMPTENKEVLETLKGANALMFGIASPAGIINMIPKRAGQRDVTSLSLSGNNFGQLAGHLDVGRRFGDEKQVGVRVNLAATRIRNGVDDLGGAGKFASAGLDWRVNSRMALQADLEYYTRDASEQGQLQLAPAVNGVVPITPVPDPAKNLLGPGMDWATYVPHSRNVQLRADYQVSDRWKLLLQVGQSDTERSRSSIRFFNYNVVTGANAQVEDTVTSNVNLNRLYRAELIGDLRWGAITHAVTVGVSKSTRDSESSNLRFTLAQRQNIFNPVAIADPGPRTLVPNRKQGSQDQAVYAYDSIGVLPGLKLLAGVRVTKNVDSVEGKPDESSTTKSPAIGILYELRPTTTLYGSSMSGLEAGPVAPSTATNANFVLAPTISRQKEVGIRDSSITGLMLNMAYFDITRANAIVDPVTRAYGYFGNVEYKGVEASANYRFLRNWSAFGSLQRLKAEQVNDGKEPENTPKWSSSAGIGYRAPWLPGLSLRASATTISRRAVNPQNQGYIPGYTLFAMGASYDTAIYGKRTVFQVSMSNVGNKRYWNSINNGQYGIGMDRSIRFGIKTEL